MQLHTLAGAGRALAGSALAALVLAPAATAAPAGGAGELNQTNGLRKQLSAAGATEHLQAFQAHGAITGNRVAGSPGFEASRAYVMDRAQKAGLIVSEHSFSFLYNADATPPTLRRESPSPKTFVDGNDYASMTFSENADAQSRPVVAVDLNIPATPGAPDNGNTSGCEPADFAGFPAGAIALIMRGTCPFGQKSANAKAAGAAAAVIMNEGNNVGRSGVINGTLGAADSGAALGTSYAVGLELANGVANGPTGTVASVRIDRVNEVRDTKNVIAETPGGDPNSVLVVGAHLDSVPRGPGINDNGSGSAGILEIAETLQERGFDPRQKLRFMWYSAEEFGLLGSNAYVNELPEAERKKIKAMLNFDMIGSPNFARFVYDGDNSAFPVGPGAAEGPEGSGELERIFHDYFRGVGLASGETPFSGRSDYGRFIFFGIPAGGLFTGAEGVKKPEEVPFYGGEAGVAYDVCYHLACDTIDNVNQTGFEQMLDAAGHAVYTVAKRNLQKNPLINPPYDVTGTSGTPGGGGLHEDHDHEDDEL
jgi:Zn-dependent M28 family amino/carboxypeptidase